MKSEAGSSPVQGVANHKAQSLQHFLCYLEYAKQTSAVRRSSDSNPHIEFQPYNCPMVQADYKLKKKAEGCLMNHS